MRIVHRSPGQYFVRRLPVVLPGFVDEEDVRHRAIVHSLLQGKGQRIIGWLNHRTKRRLSCEA